MVDARAQRWWMASTGPRKTMTAVHEAICVEPRRAWQIITRSEGSDMDNLSF